MADSTISSLVKAILAGDHAAFNGMYDELLANGDPRLMNLSDWLADIIRNNHISRQDHKQRLRNMFARELAEGDGKSTVQILDTFFNQGKKEMDLVNPATPRRDLELLLMQSRPDREIEVAGFWSHSCKVPISRNAVIYVECLLVDTLIWAAREGWSQEPDREYVLFPLDGIVVTGGTNGNPVVDMHGNLIGNIQSHSKRSQLFGGHSSESVTIRWNNQ